jgi:hypothetical protein
VIRFLNDENFRPAEIHRQIADVHGEGTMQEGNTRKWCRLFKEGSINVHDEERTKWAPVFGDSRFKRKVNVEIRQNRRFVISELHEHFLGRLEFEE